jgi:polar amino acid transport system substrate-binding protein
MKKEWLILGILCTCMVAITEWTLAAETLVLATQREGHRLSQESEPHVRCALSKLNQAYTISRGPWERAQRGAKEGTYDGFFIATRNKDRDAYAVFSEPFFFIRWLYVVKNDSGISPGDLDFHTKRFSADIGSARLTWLRERYEKGEIRHDVLAVDKPEQIVKMLATQRIDVGLLNDHSLETATRESGLSADEFKTYLIRDIPAGAYFNKAFLRANPEFLGKFNAAIKQCLAE